MSALQLLMQRARQFGVRRSIAVYLAIVVGLVLASELAIQHIMGQGTVDPGLPVLNALAIAALLGVFVFFLFQGAVEDRERASIALGNSEERFRSLTSLSADWFWETDADHRLSWLAGGQSMLKLFGSGLAYGQRIWEIKGIVAGGEDLAAHKATLGERKAFHDLELSRPGKDGEHEYHLISGEPRTDREGRFLGYRGVGRDVTEQKRAEKALRSAKDRLETALDSGALAIWDSKVMTGELFLSEGWAQMLGDPAGTQKRGLAGILERVHPNDREAALQASRCAVKGETQSFVSEIRLQTASGDWKWVVSSGRVIERDAAGRAVRMTGTVVDIDRRKRAEHALRDAEARYRTLVDLSPDAVLLHSEGRIEYANRAAAEMLGMAGPAALIGREVLHMVHPEDAPMVLERAKYLRAGPGKSDFRERRMVRPDGSIVTLEGASVSYLEHGRLVVQTVLRDISERVRAREELAEREQRFRDVVEAAGEYVWETDTDFRFTWLSERVESVLGYAHADLLGRRPQDFMPLADQRATGERLASQSRAGEPFRDLTHRSLTKSGRVIWQTLSGVPVFDANGALRGFRGTGADITAKKQAEERIQFLATRDALTGLPNRLLLADRAGQAILNAGRNKGRIAVLSLNLDRFQLVNDSLGHRVGDVLLRAVAERLSSTLRKDDTLARVGVDEFVLLWDGTREIEDVALVAQKVLNCLAPPITIDGRTLNVSASIGISVYPRDGQEFVELMKNADAARYAAREVDGNTYRFFSQELNSRALERLEMENELHQAIARGQLALLFQPVLRTVPAGRSGIGTTDIVGAEVLLHWRHPRKGLLAPEQFMPVAEQTGLTGTFSSWLIERSCEQIAAWDSGALAGLQFALNIPIREFAKGRTTAVALEKALAANRLDGRRLSVEVAQSAWPHGATGYLSMLKAVASLGIALTIDDFGTGQFDLPALRELPIAKLKIDPKFVADLAVLEDAAIVVQTLAAMAGALGLSFSADGVRTSAQLERLRAAGCEEWQGALFSPPLEAGDFESLLASSARAASA